MGQVVTAMPALEAAASSLMDLGRPDALTTFADAIAGFAHESAALGTAMSAVATHGGAWAATFAVLSADVVLIGYWRATRRRNVRGGKSDENGHPFSLRLIGR